MTLDLSVVDAKLNEVRREVDNGGTDNEAAVAALRAAEALRDELERTREELGRVTKQRDLLNRITGKLGRQALDRDRATAVQPESAEGADAATDPPPGLQGAGILGRALLANGRLFLWNGRSHWGRGDGQWWWTQQGVETAAGGPAQVVLLVSPAAWERHQRLAVAADDLINLSRSAGVGIGDIDDAQVRLSEALDAMVGDRPTEPAMLVAEDGRCGCRAGRGEHPCGHECDSCDGGGSDPESPVCTLPHGADCRCVVVSACQADLTQPGVAQAIQAVGEAAARLIAEPEPPPGEGAGYASVSEYLRQQRRASATSQTGLPSGIKMTASRSTVAADLTGPARNVVVPRELYDCEPSPGPDGGPAAEVQSVYAGPDEIDLIDVRQVHWDLDEDCRLSFGPEQPEDDGPQRWQVLLNLGLGALRPFNQSVTPDARELHRWVTPEQVCDFALMLLSMAGHGRVGDLREALVKPAEPVPVPDSDDNAEPEAGTYWEGAVLRRFVAGGAVDLARVHTQVDALLADRDRLAKNAETNKSGWDNELRITERLEGRVIAAEERAEAAERDRDAARAERDQVRHEAAAFEAMLATDRAELAEAQRERDAARAEAHVRSTDPGPAPNDGETVESLTEAAGWIRDERDQAEYALAEVLRLLDRLDESGQDYDTDLIRGVIPPVLARRVLLTNAPEDPGPAPTTPQPSDELIRGFTERVGLLREPDEDYSNEADARALLWWTLSQLGTPAPAACCSHLAGRECSIHTAPTTYALPPEPPAEVTELWDKDGDRWEWSDGEDGGDSGWMPDTSDSVWEWPELVVEYGPLSSVPPGTEPGPVVDSCLSCNGPLVRRDGKLVHQATGERSCPPPGTETEAGRAE